MEGRWKRETRRLVRLSGSADAVAEEEAYGCTEHQHTYEPLAG
jgi:hypothetical protein